MRPMKHGAASCILRILVFNDLDGFYARSGRRAWILNGGSAPSFPSSGVYLSVSKSRHSYMPSPSASNDALRTSDLENCLRTRMIIGEPPVRGTSIFRRGFQRVGDKA